MKKHLLIFVMLCPPLFFASLFAQNNAHQCHSHVVLEQQIAADPTMKNRVDANERSIVAFANRAQLRGGQQIIIPVVVHVVSSSVTDAQVISQIDALNRDFNKLNTDANKIPSEFLPLAADCEIKFQLAARTPENDPTNGIIRHASTRTEWGGQDDVKKPARGGFAPWKASKYLNIYVCPIGNGVLGYASFPGTPEEVDGVVIDPTAFGSTGTARRPFNMGRTCVHEVAHWLNLYHIWGDSSCGDDRCSDTPTQKEAHYGDITKAYYSNCGATQTRDMCMNFMDYVNDASMLMFSNGQKTRMQATLNGARASILTSDGCVPPVQIGCKVKNIVISELKTTAATLSWDAVGGVKTYTIDIKKTGTTSWLSTTTSNPTFTFSNLIANEFYAVRIKSDCATAEFSESVDFSTRIATKGADDYENNNSKAEAKEIKPNATIAALIGDEKDVDWFMIKTTDEQPNLNIKLSDLAADYDVRIYDATGKPLKTSNNKSLDNEVVSINSTVGATYFIQIYGYNNAFDAYINYTLTTATNAKPFTIDEAFEYFNKTARNVEEGSFQIYPNPVIVDATFYFDAKKEGNVTLQIADLRGVVHHKTVQNIGKDTPSVSVDLSALPSGIYIATAEQGGQIMSKKLVKH
jgi:Pregnancy-associated plasma protein-A/Secretion system C-terminal sorting domain/Fibronectin type III domain